MTTFEALLERHQAPLSRYLANVIAGKENTTEPMNGAPVLRPDDACSWIILGGCCASIGEFDDAILCYRQAISLDQSASHAVLELVKMGALHPDSDEISILKTVATSASEDTNKRGAAYFALGQVYDSHGEYDAAFRYFTAGNAMMQKLDPAPDWIKAFCQLTDTVITSWTSDVLAERVTWGHPTDIPVFVVGMPRSGTTLVEQIIASHPDACGGGERPNFGKLAKKYGFTANVWDQNTVRLAAMGQLSALKMVHPTARRIVDKMPDNLLCLGIIMSLFPNARVILCQRDMRDVALSCFFQNFASEIAWSCKLDRIVLRTREVARVADHWMRVLPHIMPISYEKLVANFETEARRIIEFVGLDWHDNCLRYYENRAQILTASVWQVRQPIYDRSVGRWQDYRRHLQQFNLC